MGTKSEANLIFLVKFRLVFPSDVIDTSEINTTRNLEIAKFRQQASKCHRAGVQRLVVRSLVSANRWLRGIKTYRFPWCLTLVSANHASSNTGQEYKD